MVYARALDTKMKKKIIYLMAKNDLSIEFISRSGCVDLEDGKRMTLLARKLCYLPPLDLRMCRKLISGKNIVAHND